MANWGIAPSEFWRMHPNHFWWIAEAKLSQNPRMYGSLTEDQVREIYEDTYDEEGNLLDGSG